MQRCADRRLTAHSVEPTYASSYRYPLRKSPDIVGTTGDPASAKKSIRRAWRLMAGFTCPDAAAGFVHEGLDTPSTRPFPANEGRRSHALEFSDTWCSLSLSPPARHRKGPVIWGCFRVGPCMRAHLKIPDSPFLRLRHLLSVCVRRRKNAIARKDRLRRGYPQCRKGNRVRKTGLISETNLPVF